MIKVLELKPDSSPLTTISAPSVVAYNSISIVYSNLLPIKELLLLAFVS